MTHFSAAGSSCEQKRAAVWMTRLEFAQRDDSRPHVRGGTYERMLDRMCL